jgi:hypothetical protein
MTATHTHRSALVAALMASVALSVPVGSTAAAANAASSAPSLSSIPRSAYVNSNERPDPFLPVRLKNKGSEPLVPVNHGELQLQGIMWHPTKPAAVVNRKRIELNETVTLKLNTGDHAVKAVVIDRDRVVLKMGEQQIELRLAWEK